MTNSCQLLVAGAGSTATLCKRHESSAAGDQHERDLAPPGEIVRRNVSGVDGQKSQCAALYQPGTTALRVVGAVFEGSSDHGGQDLGRVDRCGVGCGDVAVEHGQVGEFASGDRALVVLVERGVGRTERVRM